MNLSKKVFLVIAPVVTLFFIVAATIAYQQQKAQILKLENNRLRLALSELSTIYNQYSSFSEGYLNAIIQSNTLKAYLKESSNRYQRISLVRNIENYLRDFKRHKSNLLSLTIAQTQPQKKTIEYIELSEDPFSLIPESLEQFSYAAIETPSISQPVLLSNKGNFLLAFSTLIDPDTIDTPIATRSHLAYSITFAIEPSQFTTELHRYENDFNIKIDLVDQNPKSHDQKVVAKLNDQRYLVAEIEADHVARHLRPTWINLSILAFFFMVSCAVVIFRLVSKLVITPIKTLEQSVQNVNIEKNDSFRVEGFKKDEIGSLASEFNKMYTKLSQAYEETSELLKTDHLTKQSNLYQIKKIFHSKLAEAKRQNEKITFLYIDLDNFKFVNDRYGHDIGDKVLVSFSDEAVKILKNHFRPSDPKKPRWFFGRIAGDEFGIILTGSPSSIEVNEIVSDILGLFNGGFSFLMGKYPISASIGVVHYPKDGEAPSQLISNADKAMYQSKRLGKNRVSFYSEEIAYKIRRELEIEHELKNSSFENEFYLVFLPILHTDSLKVYGFEALLRWNSPRLGFISPAEFIPVAEACGYFEAIDSWVVEQSLASYKKIKDILGEDYVLSVNLSSAQITLNKIHEEILALSATYDIPKRQIQFEMTETTSVEFSPGLDSLLNKITEAGFKLAIDDFRSGYTSLQQLVEYPATTIKFDKSFLDATMSGGGRKILQPLVQMCHTQLMSVTVEGIENREQYEYMRSIKVDHLQGFLFCQPSTIEELPGALTTLEKKCVRLL